MKKVLFVTYDFPYPTNTGGKNRAYHMLKHSGKDIKKYLFSFVRDDSWRSFIVEMEKIGVEIAGTSIRKRVHDPVNIAGLAGGKSIFKTLYYSNAVLESLVKIIKEKEINIVHFESFYTAFYISDEIRKLGAKQIFGTENIEYQVYGEYAKNVNFLLRPLFKFQVDKIREEEVSLFKKADLCLAVSDADARVIKEYVGKCEVIRNAVDIDEFKFNPPKNEKGTRLLFVGNFTYFPNIDAINYFYDSVFKDINDEIILTIIGKKAKELKFAGDRRVVIKEFVPKIQDEYEKADAMVAPIRLGGGTNFKVLESMAAGLPVISLSTRLEGLDVKDGKHLIVVKEPEFKPKLENLLNDLELRRQLAGSARELVEREYSWKAIGNNLNTVWNNL
jgi:glycosyltransferase involved in cell wall biosynthesis